MIKSISLPLIFISILMASSIEAQNSGFFDAEQNIRPSIHRAVKLKEQSNLMLHLQKNLTQQDHSSERIKANEELPFDSVVVYKFNGLSDSIPLTKVENESGITFRFDNENNKWVKSDSSYFIYDQEIRSNKLGSYRWDLSESVWVHATKEDIRFNDRGDVLFRESYFKNASGEWEGSFKEIFSYYHEELFDSVVIYEWNSTLQNWTGRVKYKYQYSEDLNTTTTISYGFEPSTNDWVEIERRRVDKNWEDDFTTFTNYGWYLGEWNITGKEESYFNESGIITLRISYSYNSSNQSWSQYYKYELEISEASRVAKSFLWNGEVNEWEIYTKLSEKYNEDNLMTSEEFFYYEDSEIVGNYFRQWVYDFDGLGSNIDIDYAWNFIHSSWEIDTKTYRFRNGKIISGIDDYPFPRLIAYPNPVMNDLNIKSEKEIIKEARLYSSSGRMLVFNENINRKSLFIDFANYPAGFYILKVKTNSSSETFRIIK